ncbi:hypothetical protein GQ53DRAFT_809113 [Thozetella sp. PMI_491]|nr:hypothetical protein GQ53DRAFT_809113 [Thozetella sp. PMI_491]
MEAEKFSLHMVEWFAENAKTDKSAGDFSNPDAPNPILGSYGGPKQITGHKKANLTAFKLRLRDSKQLASPNSETYREESSLTSPDKEHATTPKQHLSPSLLDANVDETVSSPGKQVLVSPTHGFIISPPPTPSTTAKDAARHANLSVSPKVNQDNTNESGLNSKNTRRMARRKRGVEGITTAIRNQPRAKKVRVKKNKDASAATSPVVGPHRREKRNFFFKLPLEIREKIYSYLLESEEPILVMRLWTQRYARCRPDIYPEILRVNKHTAMEASRVLYGNNTFRYLLRDTSEAQRMPWGTPERSRRGRALFAGNREDRLIDVVKYGHLLRKLEIVVEANRTGAEYKACMEKALMALSPEHGGFDVSLETITLTVSPRFEVNARRVTTTAGEVTITYDGRCLSVVDFFSSGGKAVKMLEKINVNFVHINVHTEGTVPGNIGDAGDDDDSKAWSDSMDTAEVDKDELDDSGPRHLETTIDLRYLPSRIAAREAASNGVWIDDCVAAEARERRGAEALEAVRGLRLRVQKAALHAGRAIAEGL